MKFFSDAGSKAAKQIVTSPGGLIIMGTATWAYGKTMDKAVASNVIILGSVGRGVDKAADGIVKAMPKARAAAA